MDPMDVTRRHDDAWNEKDVEGRRQLCSPDIELEMPGGIAVHGVDQFLQVESVFWEALPDSQVKRTAELLAGDTVIGEGVLTGTQTGPFRTPQGEIPPSGNTVNLRFASLKRVVDGKIVSEHLYFDQMEFMTQLGAFPS
jgi:predicted ester cyclase